MQPTPMRMFRERGTLLGDGAMGTMLIARGLALGSCPELWNVERPDDVAAVLRAYLDAGADVLETNSFGGSPSRLADFGIEARCEALNLAAARIARDVAGDAALVLGCMGPTGKRLTPRGALSVGEAEAGFARQAAALAEGGADALCVETMSALDEACAAVRAAKLTGLPVLAMMTFRLRPPASPGLRDPLRQGLPPSESPYAVRRSGHGPRSASTAAGVTVAEAAAGLAAAGADAVGANCGVGPEQMLAVAEEFRRATTLPLVFQPNAGLPEASADQFIYPAGPEVLARCAVALTALDGCLLVGGCCGTTPAHIAAMATALGRTPRGSA